LRSRKENCGDLGLDAALAHEKKKKKKKKLS